MKLYIDDERPTPEGWVAAKTFREALITIDDHREEITHIAFDWMLDPQRPSLNGVLLLQNLIAQHFYDEPIFTHPRENYTCHSSDSSMRDKMNAMLDDVFAAEDKIGVFNRLQEQRKTRQMRGERAAPQMSKLDRLRKAKRR